MYKSVILDDNENIFAIEEIQEKTNKHRVIVLEDIYLHLKNNTVYENGDEIDQRCQ